MRKPTVDHWSTDSSLDGLLLFAQLLEELTFDYSYESFKAPALNARSISRELEHAIRSVKAGVLKEGVLPPIVEELALSLRADPVARHILGASATVHSEQLPKLRTDDLHSRVHYL